MIEENEGKSDQEKRKGKKRTSTTSRNPSEGKPTPRGTIKRVYSNVRNISEQMRSYFVQDDDRGLLHSLHCAPCGSIAIIVFVFVVNFKSNNQILQSLIELLTSKGKDFNTFQVDPIPGCWPLRVGFQKKARF